MDPGFRRVRADVRKALRDDVDLRVEDSARSLADQAAHAAEQANAVRLQNLLWSYAQQAVAEDPNPTTSGLFIQSLNDLIDAYGRGGRRPPAAPPRKPSC